MNNNESSTKLYVLIQQACRGGARLDLTLYIFFLIALSWVILINFINLLVYIILFQCEYKW